MKEDNKVIRACNEDDVHRIFRYFRSLEIDTFFIKILQENINEVYIGIVREEFGVFTKEKLQEISNRSNIIISINTLDFRLEKLNLHSFIVPEYLKKPIENNVVYIGSFQYIVLEEMKRYLLTIGYTSDDLKDFKDYSSYFGTINHSIKEINSFRKIEEFCSNLGISIEIRVLSKYKSGEVYVTYQTTIRAQTLEDRIKFWSNLDNSKSFGLKVHEEMENLLKIKNQKITIIDKEMLVSKNGTFWYKEHVLIKHNEEYITAQVNSKGEIITLNKAKFVKEISTEPIIIKYSDIKLLEAVINANGLSSGDKIIVEL